MEKAPTKALTWLKASTSTFTFKTLCPTGAQLVDMKLGRKCKGHKGTSKYYIITFRDIETFMCAGTYKPKCFPCSKKRNEGSKPNISY